MKKYLYFTVVLFLFSCRERKEQPAGSEIDKLALEYVRLGLTIGQYDSDFVDAYFGPDSLKPSTPKRSIFPKDSLLAATDSLRGKFDKLAANEKNDTLRNRCSWIAHQLAAFAERIRIFSGETHRFDEESKQLFGVEAPTHPEQFYQDRITELGNLLPGKGDIPSRFQKLANRFMIPKNKMDTIFKSAIAEARKRTQAHYQLPENENFSLEFVSNKPWTGYNWYKGNYASVIQINTDGQFFIEYAIDLACHEGYPGHHIYNLLLEKNLYRDKGWVEISLYPLFSPQSFIAEGSANYGIEIAFPGAEKNEYAKNVLLPMAGLDTTGLDNYFNALSIKRELNFAQNEVARGLLESSMTEDDAIRWLTNYSLLNRDKAVQRISFIKKYRSYVINYNYGQELVKNFIESGSEDRWKAFGWLLSNEVITRDLMKGSGL
jgi:hypothetical protein